MKVIDDNLLVKPEEHKQSKLIIDDSSDAFSRGTVLDSGKATIAVGNKVIFGPEYDTIDVNGVKYLIMHYTNVKIYFPEDK